jgi:hypothetical protein
MKVEQFFGTLQQSIIDMWRAHLETNKYSSHMALNDYYDDMPELVDQLIEDYMGLHGRVFDYSSLINARDFDSPVQYLTHLRNFIVENRSMFIEAEILSDIDAILSLIDSTLYKLKELVESGEVTFSMMFEKCGECDNKKKPKKHIKDYLKEEEE